MLELLGALVKLGLLVSSLWLYNSTSDTEAEQILTLDQAVAEAAAVYITNRFSQQVVAASEAGLGMEDRLGTNDEKWVFNSDGSIQNVATGQYLSGGAEPGSVTVSARPAAWSLEQDCLVHRDTGHLLTATRQGELQLAARSPGLRSGDRGLDPGAVLGAGRGAGRQAARRVRLREGCP